MQHAIQLHSKDHDKRKGSLTGPLSGEPGSNGIDGEDGAQGEAGAPGEPGAPGDVVNYLYTFNTAILW